MACEIECPVVMTLDLLTSIQQTGLALTILVDCSHAKNFQTWPQGSPANITIAKPIELDTAVSLNGATVADVRARLEAAAPSSALAGFYDTLKKVNSGLGALTTRNVKVGFATFDTTIVDLDDPAVLARIVGLCNAATVATFNTAKSDLRSEMGMYLRQQGPGGVTYKFQGPKAPVPRVA